MQHTDDKTANVSQASAFLGCHKSFVYKLLNDLGTSFGYKNGKLKGVRIYWRALYEHREKVKFQ